jgi:hypothetical protein
MRFGGMLAFSGRGLEFDSAARYMAAGEEGAQRGGFE